MENKKIKSEYRKEYIIDNKKYKQKDEITNKKNNNRKLKLSIATIIIIVFIFLVFSTIFAIININNNNIISGVKIQEIDVSGLSREEAKVKIESFYNEKKKKEILLKYKEYDTIITPELLEVNYDIDAAIEKALLIGKEGNIIKNNYDILNALISKKNIEINVTFDEGLARKTIDDIQSNLPDNVLEAEYYIEGDKLIITKGKEGLKINSEMLIEKIKQNLQNTNINQEYIELPVMNKIPDEINLEKIHESVYREVKDAYYTKEPFKLYTEVEGIDFDLEEAKKILIENKEKYEIQLIITKPNITIMQIGSEAFPDLLGTYSTRYDESNIDRSTNLKIACDKINEKVVLSGETFSYNKALGERTAIAGYKNAKVYENGRVVDGIGGGICQISSTLYNSALKANMEIVERKNHIFVTSYTPAGTDATVVYGSIDFKFKNNRQYAIKIKASCSNGIATISIYGIKEQEEYNISLDVKTISTIPYTVKYEDDNTLDVGDESIVQQGTNGLITETYIIKSLNGKVISTELLSKDTYSPMQKIILRGTKNDF